MNSLAFPYIKLPTDPQGGDSRSSLLATVGCLLVTRKGQSIVSTLFLNDGTLMDMSNLGEFKKLCCLCLPPEPSHHHLGVLSCSLLQKSNSSWARCLFTSVERWGRSQDYDLSTQLLPRPGVCKSAVTAHSLGEELEYLGPGRLGRGSPISVAMGTLSSLLTKGFPNAAFLRKEYPQLISPYLCSVRRPNKLIEKRY